LSLFLPRQVEHRKNTTKKPSNLNLALNPNRNEVYLESSLLEAIFAGTAEAILEQRKNTKKLSHLSH
jgi:hypothetical protein